MIGFFYIKSTSRGLGKESAVVLLAFISTALVYGFIIYSYSSLYREPSSQLYSVSSVSIFYSDGSVWRLDIPVFVSGDPLDVSSLTLNISVGRTTLSMSTPVDTFRFSGRTIYGSLKGSLTSGRVFVSGDGGFYVESFVYIDSAGRYNVVIDDDLNSDLDSDFLIRFLSGVQVSTDLSLDSDEVLVVGKGSTLSLDCLNALMALTSKPSAYVRVFDGITNYVVRVADLLANLRSPTLLISSSSDRVRAGDKAVVTVLLPHNLVLGGSQVSVKLSAGGVKILDTSFNVPSGVSGVGSIILPVR